MKASKPINIFYSYAHQDREFLSILDKYLQTLKKSGLIQTWSDREIAPGGKWLAEIDSHLESADIILLLVSPDFMASNYIYSIELQRAMEKAERNEARIIPILLRPVDWHNAPFGKLQALPRNGKPINSWRNRDEAFLEVVQEIRVVVAQLETSRAAEVDWVAEGNKLIQRGEYEKALDAYEQALRIEPTNDLAHVGRGNALRILNKPKEALEAYERAIRLNSANIEAYIYRGFVLSDFGRFNEALASFDQVLHLVPNNYIPYLGKGLALFRLQRFEEAVVAYNYALKLAPNSAQVFTDRGAVLATLGQYKKALADFDHALKLAPETAAVYILRAEVLLQLRNYKKAYESFQRAIRLNPNNTVAHLGMGEALRQMHRDEEALAAYDAVIVLDPSNALAYQTKATILHNLGRDEEALLALQQARDRGLTIEGDVALVFRLSEEAAGTQPSQTRIDFVQQFLTNAGFELQTFPGEVGFMARAKRLVWKLWFFKGLYIRILFDSQLDQSTVESIAHDARKRQCDHALVIINQQPRSSGWAQVNILRGEQGPRHFICLPIDESLILKGIARNREFATLKYYIDHRLGAGFDPYDEDSPVSGVVNFFGRQRITEEIMDDLQHGRRSGLFGIQKMGKSSVLKELQLRATFPVAYVYLTVGESLGRIYKRILEEWVASGRVKYPEFKLTVPQSLKEEVSQSEFDASAKGLLAYMGTLDGVVPLLAVFLDEIEHIVPSEGDEKTLELYIRLMDSLRGLHQETQSLSLLVAGVHPGIARDNYFWGIQKNPMHQVIKEYFLPPLDEDDCANMIRSLGEQISIQYEQNALQYILEMSGSHPLLARRICSFARKKHTSTGPIPAGIIEEVIQEFVRDPQKNAYLGDHGLWMELSLPNLWGEEVGKANHQILLKLASSDREMSEDELCAGPEQAVATQAFHVLKERSIIASPDNSGYYRISFGLFKSWIRFRHLGTL